MDESLNRDEKISLNSNVSRQVILFITFTILMIGLNLLIQNLFKSYFFPFLGEKLGDISFFKNFLLLREPINIPELIGSIIAIGITYSIKFILDKLIVFQKKHISKEETKKEFMIYLGLAIITTIENLFIQLLLGLITSLSLNLRIIIALTCGYSTKFILDRKYCFKEEGQIKVESE